MFDIEIGSIVKGEVTGIEPYGIFVKVGEYDGLIHISEIANKYVSNITNYVSVGENIFMKVKQEKRLKQLKYINYNLKYKNNLKLNLNKKYNNQ